MACIVVNKLTGNTVLINIENKQKQYISTYIFNHFSSFAANKIGLQINPFGELASEYCILTPFIDKSSVSIGC